MPDILRGNVSHGGSVRIPDAVRPVPGDADIAEVPAPDAELQTAEAVPEAPAQEPAPEPTAPPPPTREELAALYRDELDAIRTEEGRRAYEETAREKSGEIEQCIREVEGRMQQLSDDQQAFMAEYAKQLKYLAIEIAQKFTLHQVEANDAYLEKLVLSEVAKLKNTNWINVEVSNQMVQLITSLQADLARPEFHGATVAPVDAPHDTVRISADTGTTDASISEQASNLRRLFEGMEQ